MIAMSSTSIFSPSSITDTQPISQMEAESPFAEQETLPPVSLVTTQSDDFPCSLTGIHTINVPIYAHHFVNDFPDEQTNMYFSNQLLDSPLGTTLDEHMDMVLPLYALYKAFLQCHHLSTLISTNTANAHYTLCKQILHSIHEELEGDLFLAMYQLGMPAFADNIKQYCRDLSDTSAMHIPNMPTTSSSPFLTRSCKL